MSLPMGPAGPVGGMATPSQVQHTGYGLIAGWAKARNKKKAKANAGPRQFGSLKDQAKMLQYQSQLKREESANEAWLGDQQLQRMHGVEADERGFVPGGHFRALNQANQYTDPNSGFTNQQGYKVQTKGDMAVSAEGYRVPNPRKEEGEKKPMAESRQFAGVNPMFLGGQIPTLTSKNSTQVPGSGAIATVGWMTGNKQTPENKRKFEAQRSIQDTQANEWHEQQRANNVQDYIQPPNQG